MENANIAPATPISRSNLSSPASVADAERLVAVRRTGLLDTPAEESFDRLTRLAAKLIGVPATFISLVDEGRDFYKSCFGFGEPLATTRQLQGTTFCHYAIVSSGPLLIPDTMADPVFRGVPTVESLGVRAYAGIPLITDEGHAIGSFCAIDFVPRQWTELDVEILTELAASALREIKLRAALTEAEKQTRGAQEATRSREEVLAVVAHDLRTPLNFIKLSTQLIAEDPGAKENEEVLGRVQAAVDLMGLLIGDLLEVAKIESGQIAIKPKSLAVQTLLNDAVAMLEPLAQRNGIRLAVKATPDLPCVMADYERILRVFSNLIVNAIKFSSADGEVLLTAVPRGDLVRFSVIDQGAGISPEHLERIFDRFWQVDAADQRGVGLGLAIAKKITTAHGGAIGVASVVGQGSEFYFDLPIA
jgi:signal transduction histidine kinase